MVQSILQYKYLLDFNKETKWLIMHAMHNHAGVKTNVN